MKEKVATLEEHFLVFDDELSEDELTSPEAGWKVVIADDEEEVHVMTRMVLRNFTFAGKKVELISTYSAKETKEVMKREKEVAILLLDVVMETDHAGLEVVKFIREELGNIYTRIILRTGQPGQAPEEEVITQYDINDYKSKVEITVQKLYTTIIASLRSYSDLLRIKMNKKGLQDIINLSRDLFELQSIVDFSNMVLDKLSKVTGCKEASSFFTERIDGEDIVIAARGIYINYIGKSVATISNKDIDKEIDMLKIQQRAKVGSKYYHSYFENHQGKANLVFFEAKTEISDVGLNMIRIFDANVGIALDNIHLKNEVVETQKEILYTLGDIIETRSKETANHVRRVANYAYLLGRAIGMEEEEAELLKMAAPMHDVGKIGVPDYVLNKPGKLTPEEYDEIKKHAFIGYELLSKSPQPLMKLASKIAKSHHERWDGFGYPDGEVGDHIDQYARIVSLLDVYDALSHKRVYKDAWTQEEVLAFINENSGKMFDPTVVKAFMDNYDKIEAIRQLYKDN